MKKNNEKTNSRIEEKKTKKRKLILKSAIKAFAQNGYHNCRVADVTQEAGISYGLVYQYFRSKDDLLLAIFQYRWKLYLDAIEEIDQNYPEPKAKIEAIVHAVLDAYRQYPDAMKVLIMDVPMLDKFYEEEYQNMYNLAFERIAAIVKEGQDKNIFNKKISPLIAAYNIYGAIDWTIRQYVYNPKPLKKRKISIDRAKNHIVGLVLDGLVA